MFRTLKYPLSGACDYAVELPHWSCVLGSMYVGVSVWMGWSGIRVVGYSLQQHGYYSNPTTLKLQHTSNQEHTTNVVIKQNSRKLLMMDILMSETCWAHKKRNKIASDKACNTDTTPTQPHRISNTHRTNNNTTNVVIQQNSRKLLMMDILMSETCWAHKKRNKIASDKACNTDTTPTQPHRISNTHRTKNNTTNVVIQQNSRKLLMTGILMSETC